MKVHTKLNKAVALLTVFSLVSGVFGFLIVQKASAAAITAMSITGTGITANSSTVNTAITPTINFTLATSHTIDGQTIQVSLNGTSVASGQTLASTDLTLTGCTSNTLEATPGTGNNGAHEVTITNGASGNDDPVILITLDATAGPTPPSCSGAMTIAVAAAQLVAHDTTAANYAIHILTSLDGGSFFYYVGDENDVQITATVDNVLSFTIRNTADNAVQGNVGGAAVGPNLCDLGNLSTAGVQSCSYRLKVATNAVNGYYVQVVVDGGLRKTGYTITNTASGSAPTSGVEGYNILLAPGAATVGTLTACNGVSTAGNCLADGIAWNNGTGTIFNNTSASTMYSVSGPNNPGSTDTTNTALVTHRAEVDAGTGAGTYNQLATYTVVARW
jgi:hypothetical protein